MSHDRISRRRALATGATGLLVALAGCSDESGDDGSDGSDGGSGSPDGSDGTATPTPAATATPTATATPGPQLRYPELAAQTRLVTENVVWLGAERDRAMTRLRTLANGAVGVARELRGASSVTQSGITRLEDATTAVAEFVRQNVQPYFPVQEAVTKGNNVYVQQVKLAAGRGDTRALDEALGRLQTFYGNYTKRAYFESQFPNDVVHARLYDRMTRDDSKKMAFGLFHPKSGYVAVSHADLEPDDIDANGVPHHTHTWGDTHLVTAHVHDHPDLHSTRDHQNEPADRLVYAYNRSTGGFDILTDGKPDQQRMDAYVVDRTDIFGPVRLPDRHLDEAFVTVSRTDTEKIDGEPVPHGRNFGDNVPIHLQRFESAEATRAAVEDLLAANVFEQGTTRIRANDDENARDWRRVYYARDGDSLYAYMLDLGAMLVTVAPGQTEWGSRADWPGPVRDCWLGDASPQDT
ncbi:MAG: hypothetical protein ABEJ43_03015 [Haloferacaceae archaeon]